VANRLSRLLEISLGIAAAIAASGCTTAVDSSRGAGPGVLEVTWTAPTTNTDGSPLTDLASYRVYYGRAATCQFTPFRSVKPLTNSPRANQRLMFRLTRLNVGELYYVAVTAVNSRGLESECTMTTSARARNP
jgi:hypothetical protein